MIAVRKADYQNLDLVIAALLEEVGFTPDKNKGIFIKPNVVIGTGDYSIITSPAVVEALIRYFSGYKIIIGERSAVGVDTFGALERSGYLALAQRYGVEIVDLSQVARVKVEWERGVLALPQLLFENNYINVAKLKTHFLTTVSLCAKNQKGLLSVKGVPLLLKRLFISLSLPEYQIVYLIYFTPNIRSLDTMLRLSQWFLLRGFGVVPILL